MGNCFRHERSASAAVWAGDDWESVASKHEDGDEDCETVHRLRFKAESNSEKERLLGGGSSPSPVTREVKIKMSKKELEELARQVNLQGFSLEQVLARLAISDINREGGLETEHHRHWRPVLQSIPE